MPVNQSLWDLVPYCGRFTFATLPAAATVPGKKAIVTDVGPAVSGSEWVSNGTRWSPRGGILVLAQLGNPVTGLTNSEAISLQTLLPAGLMQTNDGLRIEMTVSKSGTTDGGVIAVRIGTAGTTADTAITGISGNALAAGNQSSGFEYELKLTAATTMLKVGSGTTTNGSYSVASNTAVAAGTTISSAATNPLYVSLSATSSSTNDTLGIQSARIILLTP